MKLDTNELYNDPEVKEYLERYQDLWSIMEEAYSVIEEIFGMGARVTFEVVHDTEIENYDQLFGYIDTEYSPEESYRLLQVFDDRWYTDKIDLIGERLNFMVR